MQLGDENFVLRAQGRRHQVHEFPGPLSIKTVLDGKVAWRTGRRELVVDECSFLVLNDGEPYSMDIDCPVPVRTCCVFFQHGFVENVVRSLVSPVEDLLDAPEKNTSSVSFLSRLHSRDRQLMPRMLALSQAAGAPSTWVEEQYLLLARDLTGLYAEAQYQIRRIPASRAATRSEILRRLDAAREYMHAYLHDPLRLQDIARASCLSTYHFHRSFSQAMRETPHSYLTRLRLDRAGHLLLKGFSVTDVCALVGFESLGSFSSLFRRKFGIAPSRFSKIREADTPVACYF